MWTEPQFSGPESGTSASALWDLNSQSVVFAELTPVSRWTANGQSPQAQGSFSSRGLLILEGIRNLPQGLSYDRKDWRSVSACTHSHSQHSHFSVLHYSYLCQGLYGFLVTEAEAWDLNSENLISKLGFILGNELNIEEPRPHLSVSFTSICQHLISTMKCLKWAPSEGK